MGNNSAGKGDKRRPFDAKRYNDNFDLIKWNSKKSVDSKTKNEDSGKHE